MIVFKHFKVSEQSISIDFECLFHLLSSLETNVSSKFMIFIAVDTTSFIQRHHALLDVIFIENMLYTLHATYIKHNFYADFFLRLKKLLKENFLWQIHSSRWIKSFTAQISTIYFLSMSCRCFICNTYVYHNQFLL